MRHMALKQMAGEAVPMCKNDARNTCHLLLLRITTGVLLGREPLLRDALVSDARHRGVERWQREDPIEDCACARQVYAARYHQQLPPCARLRQRACAGGRRVTARE